MVTLALDARPDPIPRNPLRALASPFLWLATVQLASDIVVGLLGFLTLLLIGLCVLGSVFVLISIPLWLVVARLLFGLSAVERARYRLTLGVDIAPPPFPARTGSLLQHAGALATNRGVWRQIAYYVLLAPLSVVNAAGVLVAWSFAPAFVLLPLWDPKFTVHHALRPLGASGNATAWLISVVALVFLLVVSPALILQLSRLDAALARALLGPSVTGTLTARVGQLETSRKRVVDSAEQERQRIERDLHDGAQQRLVSLAMTLGRARSRLAPDTDPAVRQLLDEAHVEAKQAITELRDLTRGLHPPVLTDRGLDAALSAVAARAPVPVGIDVRAEPRPSATVEALAYFVVTEALTNVAKHARATRAAVSVRRTGDVLKITVEDDGVGGADPSKGSGIAGLADRVSGVDGRLDILSPTGGPTVLTVEVPCGS